MSGSETSKPKPQGRIFSRREKWTDFLIGLIGTGLFNVAGLLLWVMLINRSVSDSSLLSVLVLMVAVVNVAAFVILPFIRPWITLGLLVAYAILFVLGIIAGLFLLAACSSGLGSFR